VRIAKVIFVIIFTAQCIVLSAQLVNIESLRKANDSVRFVFNIDLSAQYKENNNNKQTEFDTDLRIVYRSKNFKNHLFFAAQYQYNHTNQTDINNKVLMHLRYNRIIKPRFRLEWFSQFQHDKVLAIDIRQLLGLGPRIKIIDHNNFTANLGSLYMFEYERILDENRTENFDHRLSSYLSFEVFFLNKSGKFSSVTYYQPRMDKFSDYRMVNQSEISYKLTKNIAALSKVEYYYDAKPPEGIQTNNFNTLFGIKLIF
jgi:hypothetical protein